MYTLNFSPHPLVEFHFIFHNIYFVLKIDNISDNSGMIKKHNIIAIPAPVDSITFIFKIIPKYTKLILKITFLVYTFLGGEGTRADLCKKAYLVPHIPPHTTLVSTYNPIPPLT
jgi:hypothetical protein